MESQSATIGALVGALAKASLEFEEIEKKRKVDVFKKKDGGGYDYSKPLYSFFYADLAEIVNKTRKGLANNGLVIMQSLESGYLTTTLAHESGEWKKSWLKLNEQQSIKDLAAQITYFRRYQAGAIISVVADDDVDAADESCSYVDKKSDKATEPKNHAPGPADQVKKIVAAFAELNVSEKDCVDMIGKPLKQATVQDIVKLRDEYQSLLEFKKQNGK